MRLVIFLSLVFASSDLSRGVAAGTRDGATPSDIEKTLQPIIDSLATKYNCSVSVGIKGGPGIDGAAALEVSIAGGYTDRDTDRKAQVSDPYVWGSVTKLVTGASILAMVSQGKLSLSDPIPPLVDPFLGRLQKHDPSQNFTTLEELFGPEVNKVTVGDCLGMTSGIPDFDTASPSGRQPTDSFRADAYKHPNKSFSPTQLLNLPWVRTGKLQFTPGVCDREKYGNCYSSSNFVILGLLLANAQGLDSWEDFDQSKPLAPAAHDFDGLKFAVTGPPSEYTVVHGYDTTHYNHNTHAIDVWHVDGVFGGWTASDFVATAKDAAALGQAVYGPAHELVSAELQREMYERSNLTGYGYATFNLTRLTPNDVAYGHLGATYGYQSVVVFAPGLNLSIAIGTNIERDYQDQPQDVFCHVYNVAKAMLLGQPVPTCVFTPGYWSAGCKCKQQDEEIDGREDRAADNVRTASDESAHKLQSALQTVADAEAAKYNCSIAIAAYAPSQSKVETFAEVAAGTTEWQGSDSTRPDDVFIWGSITKISTGAAILALDQAGKLSLNDTIPAHVDPMLAAMKKADPSLNFSSCRDLFGPEVDKVTIYHLATMRSGIPDFDTAKPWPPPPVDPLRQQVYDNPTRDLMPPDLLSVKWVHTGSLDFTPGTHQRYSSTNFVLLGLILAKVSGAASWEHYDQRSFLPTDVATQLPSIRFVPRAAPGDVTRLHGYDRTSYNGHSSKALPGVDVTQIHGVFSGWTASDFTSDVGDAAKFAYEVYGPRHRIIDEAHVQIMIPYDDPFYGFATFNLTGQLGQEGKFGTAYGHIGATYGFDSMLVYAPGLDLSIAIASNMENDDQTHPSDTLCIAYNTVKNLILGTKDKCTYTAGGYYGGNCVCK